MPGGIASDPKALGELRVGIYAALEQYAIDCGAPEELDLEGDVLADDVLLSQGALTAIEELASPIIDRAIAAVLADEGLLADATRKADEVRALPEDEES
jgi:hypothetical protein